MSDAWQDGYDSYDRGDSNPYEPGCENYQDWGQGFWAACDDEESYLEFLKNEEANDKTNNL